MKFRLLFEEVLERGLAILAFIFRFMEISYYFGSKVFLNTESLTLKVFYFKYIAKLSSFYEANVYLVFIVMVAIFIICSRGTVALTKFVRFNVIQAILINIICSCTILVGTSLVCIVRSVRIIKWFDKNSPDGLECLLV